MASGRSFYISVFLVMAGLHWISRKVLPKRKGLVLPVWYILMSVICCYAVTLNTFNDTYGHTFGDTVLRLTGECVRRKFRQEDICGRFGGDEFVIFMPGESSRESISERMEEFRILVKDQISLPEKDKNVEFSAGIAICPESAVSYQELFEHADAALYIAKKEGKNRYHFHP